MPGLLEEYRSYLAETGQKDDRADRFIIEEIGEGLERDRPELLKEDPDFYTAYQEIKRSKYPGLASEFGSAMKSGAKGTVSVALGGLGLATGSDYLKQKSQEWGDAASEDAPSIPTLEDVAPEKKGIRRLLSEDALRYGVSKVGSVVPSIAEAGVTSLAGAAIGTAVAPGPGTVAGAATGLVEGAVIRAAIKNLVAKGLAESLVKRGILTEATEVAMDRALKSGVKEVAEIVGRQSAAIGARVGMGGANLVNSYILNSGDVASEGGDPGTAAALGLVAAIPDSILPTYLWGKLFPGVAKETAKDLGKALISDRAKKMLEAAGAVTVEGSTEYFQEALNVVARNLKEGKDPMTYTDADLKRFREAGITGAAGGGLAAPLVLVGGKPASVRQQMAAAELYGPPAPPAAGVPKVPLTTAQINATPPAARPSAATLTPEQQQARLAELQALPTPTPEEADELEVLTALVGNVAPPVVPAVVSPSSPLDAIRAKAREQRQQFGAGFYGNKSDSTAQALLTNSGQEAADAYRAEWEAINQEDLAARTPPTPGAPAAAVVPETPPIVPPAAAVVPETPPVVPDTQAADRARYDAIQQEIIDLTAQKVTADDPRVQALFTENEQIKNRYGGMPPGEVSGETTSNATPILPATAPLRVDQPSNGAPPQTAAPIAGDVRPGSRPGEGDLGGGRTGSVLRPAAETQEELKFATQHAQTPQFQQWFAGSKVVDESGAPILLYHGTTADVRAPDGLFWMTPERGNAAAFADRTAFANQDRAEDDNRDADQFSPEYDDVEHAGQNVMPVFAALKNPLDLTGLGQTASLQETADFLTEAGIIEAVDAETLDEIASELGTEDHSYTARSEVPTYRALEALGAYADIKKKGYDGVRITDTNVKGYPTPAWASFYPQQVKSAIGNRGSFDPSNPDITMATAAPAPPIVATSVEADHTAQLMLAASRLAQGGGKVDIFAQAFLQRTLAAELQSRIDALIEQHQGGDNPALQARIEKLQAALDAIGQIRGVTYSPFHLAIGLSNVEKATIADVVVLLHEGTHGKLAQDPVMAARAIKAINRAFEKMEAELVERRKATGFVESLNGDPEELLVSLVSQELAAEGIPDSTSLATQLWQWVKDLYYRTIMAMQEAFGREPDPQMALDWITNQMRRQLGGEFDWRFAHIFDRLRAKPMSVNVWTQTPMDVGAGTTPGGITDYYDPLTQSVRQPMVVPDSSEAILWNARFATGGRPDQTQTEAFKAWFKESAVVNESGAPLVVYKAMYPYNWREGKGNGQEITSINRSTEFPAFNKGESGIKISGFFGSKYTANRFADSGGMAAIYPVYLSFQNPLTIDGSGKFAGDVQFGESGRAFRDAVRSGEYDSVIIENTKDEGTIYVALTPEQIKSSIGNRGTFDPADPDICFATQANPGEELSIQHDEAVQRIRGAAVNELSTLADQMFAAVQATRATLTFDQWWAEVHGGETPHQMLETVAKTFPGAETATLGGDRMTEAMNARAAVDAKVLVKGWLANVAKRDAQSEESSASAEKDLIETARKTNRVEAEMRDATMHEATLSDALKRDIKELIRDTKNGLETAFASGELASAVREAENLAENDGIPTEYQNLFKRVLAGEVPIFKFIEAIAKLDLPLSDLSTPEIRKAISDNAESDETLLELTTPKNKPLLVALSALVRRNYEQVDLLLLRRAEQKQFLAIHGDLKAIREASEDQLQELARTFRDAKKATTFADRLKRSFVEKRAKLRKQQRTIQTAETRRESLAQARAVLVQKIDEIETSTVPQPSEWMPSEGATYLALRQDSEGRWLPEEKKLHFTPEGPAVNPGEVNSDLASNRQYLRLNPHKEGTKTYELVKRQVETIGNLDVQQTYPESRRLWFEKWLMPAGDLLLSGGGAAAARAKQMLNRWQSIVFQKQETDISVPAHEWANRLGRMTTLSGLEDNRAFLSQVYEPALAAIENNPGMDEGPALREAVKAARRRLTPDKIKEGFDEGLKDFLRRTKALSDTFAAIAKETGVFIDDDRLDGELRNAIPRGWLTAIRRMDSATVSTILIGMDAAGWKLEFKRTDPDTKAATKTSEGFRQGAIVNPGGTIVRSTAFDPLLGNSETPATPEQEAVLKDPTLLSQAIQGFFPPSVVTRWLQPFVNKPGQPLFKDVNGEPISQLTVQQAWEDAGGNIVDWIDRLLVDSTAYPTDETQETSPEADAAAWRRSMLRQIEGLYVMEAKAAADANQVRNLFDPSGKPAHMLMDARQNDLLPPEHVQHMTYDPISSKNLLATIAFHAAFGRNGEAMNRAIHEIEGGLKARVAAFQSITKRYSGTAAREDAAEAMGYKWRDLEHAAAVASQVESGAETLRASFGIGNMAGMLADVRGGLELLHFIANQTTNNPKTGLLNMLQPSQRAIARRSIGPVAIRDTARAYAQIPYDFLGGFLETFGIHLLRATDHAKNVGAMQGQGMGELPWTEVFGEGSRMGKRGEEMPVAVKAMRSLQALQRKGARIGFGKSKEFLRQGNIPFLSNTMVYMGQIAANANAAAEATSIESLVKAAMSHYEAHPGDLTNPTFRLTAKDLGAQDKAWFFDPGSFEYFRRALVEYGIGNLEQMAKEAIERGTSGQPILTKEQVAKIAVMTGNELDLQGSINTNPGVWASNPIVKFATPLIGWPIRQMAQIHDGMRDADGRASVLSVLRALGILASWSLPIGLAFTFLTDEYDDKILRKKSNLGNLDPISGLPILGPAIALTTSDLDPMDQIRSMGVRLSRAGNIYGLGADFASTVLSGMDPTSGQRQFSLDSRILAFSQIANIGQAIGNWINSGYATTYQNLERPLLQSMGGNGALQAIQIANTVLGIDNQEARITARINAGQWLRSAGREVGLEIRKSGGSSVSVTPMGAWTREMVLSALGNDRIEFLRNYERAIAAARADKKPNPEQAVLEAFRSRSPIEVFNTVPTREELDQALAAMNAGGRAAVTEALQLFDQYEQMIAPTGFEERMKRQAAARQAALTRARSGGIRRQMAVQSLSPLEERMERAAVRQQKEAALSR